MRVRWRQRCGVRGDSYVCEIRRSEGRGTGRPRKATIAHLGTVWFPEGSRELDHENVVRFWAHALPSLRRLELPPPIHRGLLRDVAERFPLVSHRDALASSRPGRRRRSR